MTFKEALSSSVGRKLVMALSGIFLILFLVVHAGINACIWAMDGGVMFNKAAHFMGSTVLIRVLEVGLFVFFFIHIIQGLQLEAYNRSKRGISYAVDYGNRGSKWYSRSMGLLGTIILIFLIVHWVHFWIPSRFTGTPMTMIDGKEHHDMFILMQETFKHLWVVILYVLACISLCYHLMHGFQSAFRTMGVHNKRYNALLTKAGIAYSVVVSAAFAAMPITMYFNLVK
ncbi:MAG: succinate dehydrogenase cytochrome b subunit [Chitinophagaceae bacterium]